MIDIDTLTDAQFDALPLVVGIDAHGYDIFEAARNHAEAAFRSYSSRQCRSGH